MSTAIAVRSLPSPLSQVLRQFKLRYLTVPARFRQFSFLVTIFTIPFLVPFVLYWLYKSPLLQKYFSHRYGRGALLLYLFHLFFVDNRIQNEGGRPSKTIRRLSLWRHFRDYFSHDVIHQSGSPPDPTKKYVIGVHPHGIISVAGWSALMSDNRAVFPGLNFRIVTLPVNFLIPLWRNFLLAMNLVSADRDSIQYCLDRNISVAIVVGGAAEALQARPNTADLTLGTRLGFVRLAIESGASLIPVFSFGETDVYEPVVSNTPGSLIRVVQDAMKNFLGVSFPLIRGRTVLPWVPLRRPITTVIGRAIAVEQVATPTLRHLLLVHQQYVKGVQAVYDEFKDQLAPNRLSELRIVDALSEEEKAEMIVDEAQKAEKKKKTKKELRQQRLMKQQQPRSKL